MEVSCDGAAVELPVIAAVGAKATSGVLELNDPAASQALTERFGPPAKPRIGPDRTWQPTLPVARRA